MRTRALVLATVLVIPTLAWGQNQPPVANAGEDKSVYTGERVMLSGSAVDPENDPIIGWSWMVVDQPANGRVLLVNDDEQDLQVVGYVQGDYVVSLTVWDGMSARAGVDYATVHVADNQPPVAVATADRTTVPLGETVCFDGSQSSDPEQGPLTLIWDFVDGSLPVYGTVACHEFSALGPFAVTLQVADEAGATDVDTVVVTVELPVNHPPAASPTAVPNAGDAPLSVAFTAGASDPDGDALSYAWDFGDPASADNASTIAGPGHAYESAGTYVAWLTVSDGRLSASYSLTVTVSTPITLSVRSASVQFANREQTRGTVTVRADFAAPVPVGEDLVALNFDDIPLFAVPFAAFRPGRAPGVYSLARRGLVVQLDFTKGQLNVSTPKMDLDGLDNANGVVIELLMSGHVGVETILMTPLPKKGLVYRRD